MIAYFTISPLYSQDKSIVVYSARKDYLITKIEKELKELTNPETSEPIFNRVTNLNQITSNIASETALREIIDFYSKQFFELNEDVRRNYDLVADVLSKNDFFLVINTNLIFDAIEYQFYLYEVKKIDKNPSQDSMLFPATNPISPLKTENIIINLKDENKYFELEAAIKRLFPKVNIPPIARITLNQDIQESEGFYFCSVTDTLKLSSSFSIDVDTEKSKLTYFWRQIDLEGNINIDNSSTAQVKNIQDDIQVAFRNEGIYKFGLKIYDGISYSNEDTINIKVLAIPEILILERKIRRTSYNALLKFKKQTDKRNEFTLLSNKYNDWNLRLQKPILNQKDTFDILKDYNALRKTYNEKRSDRVSKNKIDKVDNSLKLDTFRLPAFLKYSLDNQLEFSFCQACAEFHDLGTHIETGTKLIEEGVLASFPFDSKNLRREKLIVFLEKNGIESNRQQVKVRNIRYSNRSLSFNFLVNLIETDTTSISPYELQSIQYEVNLIDFRLFTHQFTRKKLYRRGPRWDIYGGFGFSAIDILKTDETLASINLSISSVIYVSDSSGGFLLQNTLKFPILEGRNNYDDYETYAELQKKAKILGGWHIRPGVVVRIDKIATDFLWYADIPLKNWKKLNIARSYGGGIGIKIDIPN